MRTHLLIPSMVSLGALATPVVAQESDPKASNDVASLDSITVTALRLTDVLSAGKSETSIKETPYSISIVDDELMALRAPRNFSEAMRTVPGLSQTSPRVGTQNVVSRGFSMRQAGGEFRNALRRFQDANVAPELTNVERFEVVKGPASVLYGIGGLGGALNVVTKVPNAERRYELEAGFGSYGFRRVAVDLNTPVDAEGKWSVRLNGHHESTESFQDFVDQKSMMVAPSVAWRPSNDTTLTLDYEFLRADYNDNRVGTPADGSIYPGPSGRYARSLQVNDPNYNDLFREQHSAGAQFDHRFSDNLRFHSGLLYAWSDPNYTTESASTGFVGGFTGPRRVATRGVFRFTSDWTSIAWDNNLLAKFSTGQVRHELLVGADYYRSEEDNVGQSAGIAPLDLFAPVYGVPLTSPLTVFASRFSTQEWVGVYLQDTIIPHETLRLLLSGRHTDVRTSNENRVNPALSRRVSNKPFVPRVGVVWTPRPEVSLFGSYSESFTPVVGAASDGSAFEPETGDAVEVGAKFSFADERVAATLAAFDMKRKNVVTADPARPGLSIQSGEQTSKGIEVEVDGEILPGWRLTTGYALLDTAVSRDNTLLVGQQLRGVARHGANLFTTYRFDEGALEGVGLSLGVSYEGRRSGQVVTVANAATTRYFLPDYTRVDFGASLRRERYDIILAVNNVFDEDYFSGALNRNQVFFGEGRNFTVTAKYRF